MARTGRLSRSMMPTRMRDDDDLTTPAKLHGTPGAFLQIHSKATSLENGLTAHPIAQLLYILPVHLEFDRTATLLSFLSRTVRGHNPIRREEQRGQGRGRQLTEVAAKSGQPRRSFPCGLRSQAAAGTAKAGLVRRPGKEFMHDLEIVAGVELVGGQNAVFPVDFEDCDGDHQIPAELEGVGLCEGKIVRHLRGSIRERANSRLCGRPLLARAFLLI